MNAGKIFQLTTIFALFFSTFGFSQDTVKTYISKTPQAADTATSVKALPEDPATKPSNADGTNKTNDNASKAKDENPGMGVAVSPSKLIYTTKPGATHTKEIKVTNDTKKVQKFNVSVQNFTMSKKGRPLDPSGTDSKYYLTNKIGVAPSYFEVKPGQQQVIKVTLTVPETDSPIAGWAILGIDQVAERAPLEVKPSDNTIAMGVIPSYGFGVYLYHNPPGVKNQDLEIQSFSYSDSANVRKLNMTVKNIGDGIGFCQTYSEITNLSSGKTSKLEQRNFTILPGFTREFSYEVPKATEKGKYNAVGVIDFGNEAEVKAAELEFDIK